MRKSTWAVLLGVVVGLGFHASPWAAPAPIELPTANGALLAKAQPDECFNGIGENYPVGFPCPSGVPKVNQAYVWGLAKTGTKLWFGTAPNTHCLVQGLYLGSTDPYQTGSWVCEFGQSQPSRLGIPPLIPAYSVGPPSTGLPPGIGDFRPPRLFVYDTAAQTTTEKTLTGPAAALLTTTVGIRAAGTVGDVVLLAGPALTGGINVFAFQASSGLLVGASNLPDYTNIRKFIVVDGVLYAGVGRKPSADPADPTEKLGRILRWTGSLGGTVIAFDEVGQLDSMAAELATHEGRIFVTTWPDGELAGGARQAGLYMSPAIPVGGFLAGVTEWTKVWTAGDYEADPVTAATYGGGALASFDGYLYWGTMHVPGLSTAAHTQAYPDDSPTSTEEALQLFLGTYRAISIFRGRNFTSGTTEKQVVYGYPAMPVFEKVGPDPGTWTTKPNKMGPPRWGPAGINNPLNNYTWSMAVSGGRLWVGTMDWSWLLAYGVTLGGVGAVAPQSVFPGSDGLLGADLWYFPSSNSPAFPESTAGVGNPSSYGIRNMVTGPDLYLGMANPMNLLTDPTSGPTGGWELLELKEREPNTRAGRWSSVATDGGGSLTFCNVERAGYTASRYLPLSSIIPQDVRLPWRPKDVLLVTSSADWRGADLATCGANGLAKVSFSANGLSHESKILQLVWKPNSGTWAWEDITSQAKTHSDVIEGTLNGEFLGILAIQRAYPIPASSPWLLLAGLLGIIGFVALRRT